MGIASTVMIAAAALCSASAPVYPPAVVELYTSQGCSSCPPADRWLGTLDGRYGEQVLALSLHVGYWDYIGWKDPFARREFNERQSRLAAANGSGSVYTPGVFVQGRELRGWSIPATFNAALKAARREPAAARLALSVQSITPSAVTVQAQGAAPAGARLWLALVQDSAATAVSAGENRGETLRDHHVVRDWRGPFPAGERVQALSFPEPAGAGGWSVVGLIDRPDGATLNAVRVPLAGCATAGR